MLQEDAWCIIQRTQNEYVWQEVNVFAGRQQLLLSTVQCQSNHGLAMSAITIRCQKSHYSEQWMVVVAEEDCVTHGGTTSRNGQASHCRRCCAAQMT